MSQACEKRSACYGLLDLCLHNGVPRELAHEFWSWARNSYATSAQVDMVGSLLVKCVQEISCKHYRKGYRDATTRAVEVVEKANQQIGEPLAGAPVPPPQLPGHQSRAMSS